MIIIGNRCICGNISSYKTIFITGATRGIGKAIALKFAEEGANIVIAAKTVKPHPKLPGTIFDAAEEIESAGGKALPFALIYEMKIKLMMLFSKLSINLDL